MNAPFRRGCAATCLVLLLPVVAHVEDPAGLPLRKGDPVTILRADGTSQKARFFSAESDPPRLRLAASDARKWGGGSRRYELPTGEISSLQTPGDRDYKERRILTGTLIGMVIVGALVAPSTGPSRRWTFTEAGEAVLDTTQTQKP
jgi:hypothetical protein